MSPKAECLQKYKEEEEEKRRSSVRGRALDTDLTKTPNVQSQNLARQLVFLSICAYFASIAFLISLPQSENGEKKWAQVLSSMLIATITVG